MLVITSYIHLPAVNDVALQQYRLIMAWSVLGQATVKCKCRAIDISQLDQAKCFSISSICDCYKEEWHLGNMSTEFIKERPTELRYSCSYWAYNLVPVEVNRDFAIGFGGSRSRYSDIL